MSGKPILLPARHLVNAGLAAAAVLYVLWSRTLFPGQLIKLYIIVYMGYRFATEFIRPEARLFGGLTGYQWTALLMAGLFAYLWWRDAKELRRPMVPS